jgi:pimeloyl-ACP methyl ester carboxylesterase
MFQRRLIYHPCRARLADLTASANQAGFKPWLDPQGGLMGWFRPGHGSVPKRQIMLLHGNAGCARDWFHYADAFQALERCDFYILEYPGFGGRSGPLNQSSVLRAAEEAFRTLPEPCKVFLVGESLGTGVAAWLAGAHDRQIGGVFLVAPYVHLTAVAQRHLPLFPVSLMLRDKYPADQWLADYHGALAVLLAGQDQVVPTELGQELFDRYSGPKKVWLEPAAGHDEVHRPPREVFQQVILFWDQNQR